MSISIMQGKIQMPLFKEFVPQMLRPWIYLFFAFVFQLSDCVYLGSISRMAGTTPLTREDIMMCGFFSMVGVNMPFPFLFRLKFRFMNKQMLFFSAGVILIANVVVLHCTFMPLLCLLCYVAGFCKLWGTFECMSNIQLWLTPERDFSIFFPFLYFLVLGDIQLSEVLNTYISYYYSWQHMQYLIIGLLLVVLLILATSTKMFRIMKLLPLYGMDWLGCVLWSALLLQLIYIFNYGEYYNWCDGRPIRCVLVSSLVTGYFCINRMRHIRHPFISPDAWKYKNLVPLLALFMVSEILCSTPNVLQSMLTEQILHFDSLHTVSFSLCMIAGIGIGCAFTLAWTNRLHLSYIKLLGIGYISLVLYQVMLYFIVSPQSNIELFYLPNILRGFGYAVIFCALTIYLEELMPFRHFFHGLFIIGIVRTGLGTAVGGALYGFGLRFYIADNIVRYLGTTLSDKESFISQLQLISIKQLFGWTALAGLGFLLIVMLFDIKPIRNRMKKIPYWNIIRKRGHAY